MIYDVIPNFNNILDIVYGFIIIIIKIINLPSTTRPIICKNNIYLSDKMLYSFISK